MCRCGALFFFASMGASVEMIMGGGWWVCVNMSVITVIWWFSRILVIFVWCITKGNLFMLSFVFTMYCSFCFGQLGWHTPLAVAYVWQLARGVRYLRGRSHSVLQNEIYLSVDWLYFCSFFSTTWPTKSVDHTSSLYAAEVFDYEKVWTNCYRWSGDAVEVGRRPMDKFLTTTWSVSLHKPVWHEAMHRDNRDGSPKSLWLIVGTRDGMS